MEEIEYKSITEDMVIGHLETKVRTYELVLSGRYLWDEISFNEDVCTKYLSYGKLTYEEGVTPYESKVENAVRYYAMVMDAYKPGDIIHICHKSPFTYNDYILLSNEIILDNYGVGLYLTGLDDICPYGKRWAGCVGSVVGESYTDVPELGDLFWFDFISYYSPDKKSVEKYRRQTLKSMTNRIHEYEREITETKKCIEQMKSDRRLFNERFTRFIKQIRTNAKSET